MEKRARYSRQREAILNYLKGTTAHPTAEQIYSDLKGDYPELSLATVYRNLGYLLNNGEIMKINIEGTTVRYDYTTNCHYHLVCISTVSGYETKGIRIRFTPFTCIVNFHISNGMFPDRNGNV